MAVRFILAMCAMKIQEHTLVSQKMKQEWMKTSLLFLWKILLERPVCIEYTHTHTHTHGKKICLQWRKPRLNPWAGKIPWRREWQAIPVFLPGESHGQKRLVSYNPWGRKESDTTEWLTHTYTHITLNFKTKLFSETAASENAKQMII